MHPSEHVTVRVTDASQSSEARMVARDLASAIGLDETDVHRTGIVATELATNLVKYADRGEILARAIADAPAIGIELVSIDRGPGVVDLERALTDGHSTSGSPGTGFGAVRRLSEEFDVHSTPRGTVVLSRVYARRRARQPSAFTVGAVSVGLTRDEPCGDSWAVRLNGHVVDALVVDGLGHGLFAAEAARAAVETWLPMRHPAIADALSAIHDGLRHTRGAAGAVLALDRQTGVVRFAGVGNIAASIVGVNGRIRQAVSHNGTLGHEARHIREFSYPWERGCLLIVHSDGLASHWTLEEYPGLARRHPTVIAAVLYRDFSRGRDDVTVLVCREAA